MNIAVVGTGYVGLVTGTCFAESGNNVVCVDIDPEKLQKLNSGIIPIYEPGLEAMFLRNIKEKRLTFTNNLAEAANNSEIIFLALPTPPMEDGSADLKYVLNVAKDLAKIIKDYKVVVNKSTVPVGTADKVKAIFTENTQVPVDVCSNPEFLREGSAVEDFMKPERVVVGTDSTRVVELMSRLYKPFVMSGNSVIFMDIRSAELTKYAANSFLATKITFMNEIANLCERVGADVDNVRIGIGSDSRIGKRFLFPGIGYGGSCFPKDVQALHHTATEYQYDFQILTAVMAINNHQKEILIDKVISFFGEDLTGLSFAVWGLAFKPNTDDIREAPALVIIQELLARGAAITAFDPEAISEVKKHYPQLNITFAANRDETLKNQDALLIVTEWNEFRTPDFGKMKTLLKQPVVFDGRNILNINEMQSLGFYYNSIGRQTVDGRKKT
ncbi:MAG: UDP-glucose/GDP-mannose dehydrogenase family protein [Bacteroidia bacterium]|nr:UDP-glucose/GDP-mannose dehydrogenase family protein [Bacteroidia bacterium]